MILPINSTRGMIRLGEHCLGHVDRSSTPTIWNLEDGTIEFKGSCFLNQGTKINVGNGGRLVIGDHVTCTGNSEISCNNDIAIGEYSLLSWDILLLDSDQHKIIDFNENILNAPKPISIGKHVWIGCRSTLLKGAQISDNCVIASGSIITKPIVYSNAIIAGSGSTQRVIKKDISWKA